MNLRRFSRFLLSYVIVGLVVAALVVLVKPDLLQQPAPVVELQRAPEPAAGVQPGFGPVSYAAAVEKAAPAVVNIFSSKRVAERSPLMDDPLRYFFRSPRGQPLERVETSLGSGVILSPQGYVLTNHHVIQGAQQIQVALNDGRAAAARVVGVDPETDLAVLKIELSELPSITLGDSTRLRVGDVVLAIGNPFGVGQTVTQGIISATGRNQLGLSTFEDFVQTDAAINPGNSGGALINAHGDLIGINTAIFTRSGGSQGIGFAIPSALAEQVLASIIEHGRMIRGWLGVEIQMLTPQLAESFGVDSLEGAVVAGVLRGGPAERAGLRPGDIILKLDGQPVQNAQTFLRLVSQRKPGEKLRIEGLHQGDRFETDALVDERPDLGQLR